MRVVEWLGELPGWGFREVEREMRMVEWLGGLPGEGRRGILRRKSFLAYP